MLLINTYCYNKLIANAIEKYPAECCGFLLGEKHGEQKIVSNIIVCENKAAAIEKEFLISPKDYMTTEKKADESGLVLLGIYHSHPDSDAIPSATDTKDALPFFSYLIISVFKNKIKSSRSWLLGDMRFFNEEKLIVNYNKLSKNNPVYGNHNYSHTAS